MRLALGLALLAAALAAVDAQENAACVPLPPPPGDAIKAASDNGITNPALLDTLVKAVDEVRVYRDSKTIVDQPLKAPPAEVGALLLLSS
ncbi:hypothetical protein COHA_007982 [Chlorella ohadii]|uniref:Uncharacterized protein n=1 Tax=Chlorella ohadii TaxID=2649997 RepID=A0AAD5H2X0_9CHLO|nr:hypothetical protein COHA_007982 [Chlorella ohadii]